MMFNEKIDEVYSYKKDGWIEADEDVEIKKYFGIGENTKYMYYYVWITAGKYMFCRTKKRSLAHINEYLSENRDIYDQIALKDMIRMYWHNHKAYLQIAYPINNKNWTFAVWDWIQKFCEEFPKAKPIHGKPWMKSRWQYIDISAYKNGDNDKLFD